MPGVTLSPPLRLSFPLPKLIGNDTFCFDEAATFPDTNKDKSNVFCSWKKHDSDKSNVFHGEKMFHDKKQNMLRLWLLVMTKTMTNTAFCFNAEEARLFSWRRLHWFFKRGLLLPCLSLRGNLKLMIKLWNYKITRTIVNNVATRL